MKKILITGANGTIGTILKNNLKNDYDITEMDLPQTDITQYDKIIEIFPGHNIIVHLAWNVKTENFRNGKIDVDNALMFSNVYKTAIETKIPRVIMASSIHAENFYKHKPDTLLSPNLNLFGPDSPYGASKIFMESLGKYYSQNHGLEVVCIRFGGVNLEDKILKPEEEDGFDKIWLSHRDLTNLIKTCIEVEKIPNNFLVVYGISNNSSRIHDYSNPIGWVPGDNSMNYQ